MFGNIDPHVTAILTMAVHFIDQHNWIVSPVVSLIGFLLSRRRVETILVVIT